METRSQSSHNGVFLNELQYDGKQLVDPQTAQVADRMFGRSDLKKLRPMVSDTDAIQLADYRVL
jgi:hypothetical protein